MNEPTLLGGKLWMPPTAVDDNRLVGLVIAVGETEYHGEFRPVTNDLKFGDIVEISRWTDSISEPHAIGTVFGRYGSEATAEFLNAGRTVEMGWDDSFVMIPPDGILFRMGNGFDASDRSEVQPVYNRVMIRLDEEKTHETLEIVKFHLDYDDEGVNPVCLTGEVTSVGGAVASVAPGDKVVFEPKHFTRIRYDDGTQGICIRETQILCRL